MMIFSFVVRKFGIRKMRKLRHTHNYSKILPNFIELLCLKTIVAPFNPAWLTAPGSPRMEWTVPKNVFHDFDTLALVLNRDSDQDYR